MWDGTVFLDELLELPVELQAKLLRAVDSRRIRPVGTEREVSFSARIVASTRRDPREAVRAGILRDDLFYRLAGRRIRLSPLRERPEDVLPLFGYFLERATGDRGPQPPTPSVEAASALLRYPWPGNVRELRSCAEHAIEATGGAEIGIADLPPDVHEDIATPFAGTPAGEGEVAVFPSLREVIEAHLRRGLELARGNREVAARLLKVSTKLLQRRLGPSRMRRKRAGRAGPPRG